ncbi:MAG: GNAT family N-acetyltransferase [Defluviitaleaceae bacterium]|nr:GNAT family N-acetyltransferase [Defluviitaleaceae bacterium]
MSLFKRKKYEYPLLEDFLYHAIFVPPNEKPFPRDEIYKPEIFMYIDGFGNKHGDCGVIAKRDGEVIGAAWTRIIPAFGHIDNSTPELATSVTPTARKRGIGTRMLTHLFELLRNRGFAQTSLSVQKENPATRLYQRLGYEILRENDEDWIMLRGL